MSDWYQRLFPTRLSQERQAVPEFETTAQGCRLATSVGGVLTGRGADMITDIRLAKGFAISPWSSMLSAVASLTRLWRRSSMSAWPWPPAPWRCGTPAPDSLVHHAGVQYACEDSAAKLAAHLAKHEPDQQPLRQRHSGKLHGNP